MRNLLFCVVIVNLVCFGICRGSEDREQVAAIVSGVFRIPEDYLVVSGMETNANDPREKAFIKGFLITSKQKTLSPIQMAVAKKGYIFTDEIKEDFQKRLKDSASKNMFPLSKIRAEDGVAIYTGAGGFGPGGSAEWIYAVDEKRGVDYIVSILFPADPSMPHDDKLGQFYHDKVAGDPGTVTPLLVDALQKFISFAKDHGYDKAKGPLPVAD